MSVNIRLGCKWRAVTITLAYNNVGLITVTHLFLMPLGRMNKNMAYLEITTLHNMPECSVTSGKLNTSWLLG
jgi:hypothetical protein